MDVYMHMCGVHVSLHVCVGGSGQLVRASFLLPLYGFQGLWEPVLSFHYMDSRDWTQVVNLGGKRPQPPNHLPGPWVLIFILMKKKKGFTGTCMHSCLFFSSSPCLFILHLFNLELLASLLILASYSCSLFLFSHLAVLALCREKILGKDIE